MASSKQKQKAPGRGGAFVGAVTLILGGSAAFAFWSSDHSQEGDSGPLRSASPSHHWHLNLDRGAGRISSGESAAASAGHDSRPSFRMPAGPPTISAKPPSPEEVKPAGLPGEAAGFTVESGHGNLVPIVPPSPSGSTSTSPGDFDAAAGAGDPSQLDLPPEQASLGSDEVQAGEVHAGSDVGDEAEAKQRVVPPASQWQRAPAQRDVSDAGAVANPQQAKAANRTSSPAEPEVWGRVLDIREGAGRVPDVSYRLMPRGR